MNTSALTVAAQKIMIIAYCTGCQCRCYYCTRSHREHAKSSLNFGLLVLNWGNNVHCPLVTLGILHVRWSVGSLEASGRGSPSHQVTELWAESIGSGIQPTATSGATIVTLLTSLADIAKEKAVFNATTTFSTMISLIALHIGLCLAEATVPGTVFMGFPPELPMNVRFTVSGLIGLLVVTLWMATLVMIRYDPIITSKTSSREEKAVRPSP